MPMVNLSDEDFTIKKGDTVTRGVLSGEVVMESNEHNRKINQEPSMHWPRKLRAISRGRSSRRSINDIKRARIKTR